MVAGLKERVLTGTLKIRTSSPDPDKDVEYLHSVLDLLFLPGFYSIEWDWGPEYDGTDA